MLDTIADEREMTALTGEALYRVWTKLCAAIDEKYDTERQWNSGGKAWKYEYKYRRGGKTLCALYSRENCVGFMVVLGRARQIRSGQKLLLERSAGYLRPRSNLSRREMDNVRAVGRFAVR